MRRTYKCKLTLKPGDKIKIRSMDYIVSHFDKCCEQDPFYLSSCAFIKPMFKYAGKVCTVKTVHWYGDINIVEDNGAWNFSPDVFTRATKADIEQQEIENIIDKLGTIKEKYDEKH